MKRPASSVGSCLDCGKQCFLSRKAARTYMRAHHPQEKMSVYQCGEYFHYGHTPYVIRRGITDRREYPRG